MILFGFQLLCLEINVFSSSVVFDHLSVDEAIWSDHWDRVDFKQDRQIVLLETTYFDPEHFDIYKSSLEIGKTYFDISRRKLKQFDIYL